MFEVTFELFHFVTLILNLQFCTSSKQVFRQIGLALPKFHKTYQNRQHGDFQPSNIFCDLSGPIPKITMIDIGGMGFNRPESDFDHFVRFCFFVLTFLRVYSASDNNFVDKKAIRDNFCFTIYVRSEHWKFWHRHMGPTWLTRVRKRLKRVSILWKIDELASIPLLNNDLFPQIYQTFTTTSTFRISNRNSEIEIQNNVAW